MKKRRVKLFIEDSIDAMVKIERYTKNLDYIAFIQNDMIIGRGCKKSGDYRGICKKYSDPGKREISGYSMEKNDWIKKHGNSRVFWNRPCKCLEDYN